MPIPMSQITCTVTVAAGEETFSEAANLPVGTPAGEVGTTLQNLSQSVADLYGASVGE